MSILIESDASKLARAAVDIIHAAGVGPLDLAKIHLGKASTDITKDVPLATLTAQEADFTGYAAATLVWDVPGFSSDNVVEVVSVPVIFRPTDAVTPNQIYNAWVSNTAGSVWYFAGQVDNPPIPLPDATHQVIVTVRYRPATNSVLLTIS